MSWPSVPVVGADVGTWGQKINAIFDALFRAQDGDSNLFGAIAKELTDARGNYSSLALRLAAGSGGTGPSPTTGSKNTYVGAGNTYASNQY